MSVDPRLYGIAGNGVPGDPAAGAAAAARGGATLIQYRDKQLPTRELVRVAEAIREALEGSGVPLIVNDRVDVAAASRAGGVHLGQDDMAVADARRILGRDAIIGLTLKFRRHIEEADFDLIDYAAIGGVFATASKDNPDAPVGLDGLRDLAALVRARRPGLPIVAIAGINERNAADVIAAGADGVSVISALFGSPAIGDAAGRLRGIVDAALASAGREHGR